jgi:hypothetical protein
MFIDDNGYFRAQVPSPDEAFGHFLERDIQGSEAHANDIFDAVEAIQTGAESYRRMSGNAHVLVLTLSEARIESLYEERVSRLSLEELVDGIHQWMAFLEERP